MLQTLQLSPSPLMLSAYLTEQSQIEAVVFTDVLRASTTILAGLAAGAEAFIPVETLEELSSYRGKTGVLIAGERNCLKVDFADLGNDPEEYIPGRVFGKTVVLSTTNGTQNLRAVVRLKPKIPIIVGSIGNLSATASYLERRYRHVLVAASGWRGTFSLEDSLFAGLLCESFSSPPEEVDDGVQMALAALHQDRGDWKSLIQKGFNYQRLKKLLSAEKAECALEKDTYTIVPTYCNGSISI